MITQFQSYKNNGLSGLCNMGNTCFINSCIQILSHTYELNEVLKNNKIIPSRLNNNIVDTVLLTEWIELRNLLWNENCVISPGKFIHTIQQVSGAKSIELFTGYSQNDISEFFVFIINCFHNSISRKIHIAIIGKSENETDELAVKCYKMIKEMYEREYSEIYEVFYAISVNVIESIETGENINIVPELFSILSLPVTSGKNEVSLIECFDSYTEGELLVDDNAIFNEKTQRKEDVKKYITFWNFPQILVIELKRYNNQNKKKKSIVYFPLENLDLSKYVSGYNKKSFVYDLYGVCNHSGSVLGGHYTCYVKNANQDWYKFNDTIITKIENLDEIVSPQAYCFFYRKRPI